MQSDDYFCHFTCWIPRTQLHIPVVEFDRQQNEKFAQITDFRMFNIPAPV